jgi:hypothetical protein
VVFEDALISRRTMMADGCRQPRSKKRTGYAPQALPHAEDSPTPPAVVSVLLDEGEDVEWVWTHAADGMSVVTGYKITKSSDRRREQRETSDDG